MHDKFMVVDSAFIMTGSFNWTYSAGAHNQENVAIIGQKFYIDKYSSEFNRLWNQFKDCQVHKQGGNNNRRR